jgi:hypothetical protein
MAEKTTAKLSPDGPFLWPSPAAPCLLSTLVRFFAQISISTCRKPDESGHGDPRIVQTNPRLKLNRMEICRGAPSWGATQHACSAARTSCVLEIEICPADACQAGPMVAFAAANAIKIKRRVSEVRCFIPSFNVAAQGVLGRSPGRSAPTDFHSVQLQSRWPGRGASAHHIREPTALRRGSRRSAGRTHPSPRAL